LFFLFYYSRALPTKVTEMGYMFYNATAFNQAREDFNVSNSITIAVGIYHGIYAPRVHHGRSALSFAPSSSRLGAAPASSTFDVDIERGRLPLARHRFKFQTRRARTRARKPRSRPRVRARVARLVFRALDVNFTRRRPVFAPRSASYNIEGSR